jgi:hypothetical protein
MKIDVKALLIGLLLGICVPLSMGQRAVEPAHKLDADYRYQISAVSYLENGQNVHALLILDHETNKVHSVRAPWVDNTPLDIKRALSGQR